ncbi:MAG: hypothetical protein R2734_15395 [Nocardioides sp.]
MPSVATARVAAPLLVLALLAGACSSQSQGQQRRPGAGRRHGRSPGRGMSSAHAARRRAAQQRDGHRGLLPGTHGTDDPRGRLPGGGSPTAYDDPGLGAHAYTACSAEFRSRLGADDSTALRTVLNWAWFRPSEAAWKEGARWFRCDVVGGTDQAASSSTCRRPWTACCRGVLTTAGWCAPAARR